MVLYLTGGWYTHLGERRLRDEVVDGAIDTASTLFRAGIHPRVIEALALKIRALASYAAPPHRRGAKDGGIAGFTESERLSMQRRLRLDTDSMPALQCFINDCLEQIHDAMDLHALYLHLLQITQMMQLLQAARSSEAAAGLVGRGPHANTAGPSAAAHWAPPPLAPDATHAPAAPAGPHGTTPAAAGGGSTVSAPADKKRCGGGSRAGKGPRKGGGPAKRRA